MPKRTFAYAVGDISALARFLTRELRASAAPPGHVDMLNLLARAAGFRNFQHFRAQPAPARDAMPPAAQETKPRADKASAARLEQVLRCFGADGRFERWPSKVSHQILCLWALWTAIPARRNFSERQFNAFLKERHSFGDHAFLRRMLCDLGLVTRAKDGSVYRRVEQAPPEEADALIAALNARVLRTSDQRLPDRPVASDTP